MRVALVAHGIPPDRNGGVEVYALALARRLRENHEAELFVPVGSGAWPAGAVFSGLRAGIPVTHAIARGRPEARIDMRIDEIDEAFGRFLDRFRPDAVHFLHLASGGLGPAFIAAERAIPAVWSLFDYWPICHRTRLLRPDGALCPRPTAEDCANCLSARGVAGAWAATVFPAARTALIRQAAASMSRLIMLSAHLRNRLVEESAIWSRSVVLPLPLLAPLTRVREARRREPGDGRPLVVGFIGTANAHKGLHVLLEAAGDEPGIEIVAAGGANVDYLSRIARSRSFRYLGPYSIGQLPGILEDFDLTVVPSVWEETQGMVVAESLAARVPVLASEIGGLRESAAAPGCRFVPPGDASSLRELLRKFRDEPSRLASLREEIGPPADPAQHWNAIEAMLKEAVS